MSILQTVKRVVSICRIEHARNIHIILDEYIELIFQSEKKTMELENDWEGRIEPISEEDLRNGLRLQLNEMKKNWFSRFCLCYFAIKYIDKATSKKLFCKYSLEMIYSLPYWNPVALFKTYLKAHQCDKFAQEFYSSFQDSACKIINCVYLSHAVLPFELIK